MMEAFVERQLELSQTARVVVRFGRPVADGSDFRCDYEIGWPEYLQASSAWGIDEVQALLLAMEKAHVDLLVSDAAKSGQLRWMKSEDFGFPLSGSVTKDDFK